LVPQSPATAQAAHTKLVQRLLPQSELPAQAVPHTPVAEVHALMPQSELPEQAIQTVLVQRLEAQLASVWQATPHTPPVEQEPT